MCLVSLFFSFCASFVRFSILSFSFYVSLFSFSHFSHLTFCFYHFVSFLPPCASIFSFSVSFFTYCVSVSHFDVLFFSFFLLQTLVGTVIVKGRADWWFSFVTLCCICAHGPLTWEVKQQQQGDYKSRHTDPFIARLPVGYFHHSAHLYDSFPITPVVMDRCWSCEVACQDMMELNTVCSFVCVPA